MTPQTYIPFRNRHTVLLIGSGYGELKRIAFSLQHKGHSIIWADDGVSGVRTAETELPDLIICETVLEDVSGFDVCQRIKSSLSLDTPFVLMGKLGDEPSDLPRAFHAGADDYFAGVRNWQLVVAKLQSLLPAKAMTFEHAFTMTRSGEPAEICFE